jgi:hypothetical protein
LGRSHCNVDVSERPALAHALRYLGKMNAKSLQVPRYNLQKVVKVVRDATGKLTDRLHFLGLMQRRLRLVSIRDFDSYPFFECLVQLLEIFRCPPHDTVGLIPLSCSLQDHLRTSCEGGRNLIDFCNPRSPGHFAAPHRHLFRRRRNPATPFCQPTRYKHGDKSA